jgi:copper transport protein
MSTLLRVCALGFAVALLAPGVASAHASLVRSDPAPESVVERAPSRATLWFAEPIESRFSGIEVYDTARKRVDAGDFRVAGPEGKSASVGLGELPDGTYTVSWRNVSSVDGHSLSGSFAFSVGDAPPVAGPVATEETDSESGVPVVPSALLRALNFLAMAVVVGAFGFHAFVWTPCLQAIKGRLPGACADELKRHAADRTLGIARWGLVALAAGSVGFLALQAVVVSSEPLPAALGGPLWELLGTRFGLVWLARLVMLMALAALLLGPAPQGWRLWTGLALGAGVLLTSSLNSHGAATGTVTLALDWLHLVAMSLWVGGLVQLALVLPAALRRLDPGGRATLLGSLVPCFSRLALASVGILVGTGVYAAVVHVRHVDALTGTAYGLTLLCKLALLLPLLALGAANLYSGSERLRRLVRPFAGPHAIPQVPRFLRRVRAEVVLVVGVLAATGALTSLSPASQAAGSGSVWAFSQVREVEGGSITLSVDPAAAGPNTIDVLLVSSRGERVTDAEKVAVRLQNRGEGVGQSEEVARRVGSGHYTLSGPYLTVPGVWEVAVVARRPAADDLSAEFSVPVSLPHTASAGGLRFVLDTEPQVPRAGDQARLELSVADTPGRLVSGLRVGLTLVMPAHAHYVDGTMEDEGGGRYAARAELDMPGEWVARVRAERAGAPPVDVELGFLVRE